MFQFVSSSLVAHDDGMGVELEGADSPLLADATLDGMLQGAGLAVSVAHNEYLAGVHNRAHAYSQGGSRHLVHIALEETAIGNDGVCGQALHPGAACKAAEGLVEGDVPVGAYTAHKEVYAAGLADSLLVGQAFGLQVGRVAVENVHVLPLDVYVAEEIVPHEAVVALGMLLGQAYVLVHVEGDNVLEADAPLFIQTDEVAVHAQGAAAGRASQLEGFLYCGPGLVDASGHVPGSPFAELLVIGFDDYSHSLLINNNS